jgi:hypothetical protein
LAIITFPPTGIATGAYHLDLSVVSQFFKDDADHGTAYTGTDAEQFSDTKFF